MADGGLPHVVILGGGFGGIAAARALRKAPVRVTLVDRRNHHLFQPLLYQVATAALSAPDIAAPIRHILRKQKNTTVLMANAERIDTARKTVVLSDGELAYDWLIVATGATNSFFGNDHWEQFAPGLKTLPEALRIRSRVLTAYENAERETDPEARQAWLTFAVIGAGPTGVEMAGALSEIARTTLTRDFRNFDPKHAKVYLIEGMSRVLAAFPEDLSASALKQLNSIGVETIFNERVTNITAEGLRVGERWIAARTVVWAAGVKAEADVTTLGQEADRMGRIKVEPDTSLPGNPNVFVIGDTAHLAVEGTPLPGVAPVAMQQGQHAARMILRHLHGKPSEPFVYFDKGSMATIGRRRAVAMTGTGTHWPKPAPVMKFTGFMAWMAWLFVHVLVLVEFRNRLAVLMDWAWAYVTFQRSARVILNPRDEG
jgi:NADH:ubiquinone reductase (H+-translocating)